MRTTKQEREHIDRLVAHYQTNQRFVAVMLSQLSEALLGTPTLMDLVHSTKSRLKDPDHLKDKLFRKLEESKKKKRKFSITEKNLFHKINDLAGFRILHLHTEQIISIDRELRKVFREFRLPFYEDPKAKTWDDESRAFFEKHGLKTEKSPTMYTSVHYVVESNSNTRTTCEIQVRTLAEELWGEVDHTMNYPHECAISSCREQIKVLARVTSSCTRLVDSIFRTYESGEKI